MQQIIVAGIIHYRYLPIVLLIQRNPVILAWYYSPNDIDKVYQFRRHYVRENKNDNVPTLTANMGTGGHNVPIILQKKDNEKRIRKLTPAECFNFQGFPKSYKLPKLSNAELYKQSGNSVTVELIKLIAQNIYKVLNKDEKPKKKNKTKIK